MESKNRTQIIAEAGKHDFSIVREFNAAKETVFKAFATPKYLKQWFMPIEMAFTIEKMECKTGGSFENYHSHPNGMKFGFRGVYHEVSEPNLIIKTSEFTGLPQKMLPVLETTTFENTEVGNTKVTIHTLCASSEFRDAMIQNGMEQHLKTSHRLLDELLTKL
jgi:uncharacterized protein YndB with AHSA1/START domain